MVNTGEPLITICGKLDAVDRASERVHVTLDPAEGVPQVHPVWLVTEGEPRLLGTAMATEVVTALDAADPALLTVTVIVPVEPVDHEVAAMATLRSAPFTIWMVAVAALSNAFTSLAFVTEACTSATVATGEAGTVPLITMLAKLCEVASEEDCVHVSTAPAVTVPQDHPPEVVDAAIDGLPRSAGTLTVTVVEPETVDVPELLTPMVMLAALPATQTVGEFESTMLRLAPLTTTTFVPAESLSEFGSPALLTVAINGASWLEPELADPVNEIVIAG